MMVATDTCSIKCTITIVRDVSDKTRFACPFASDRERERITLELNLQHEGNVL